MNSVYAAVLASSVHPDAKFELASLAPLGFGQELVSPGAKTESVVIFFFISRQDFQSSRSTIFLGPARWLPGSATRRVGDEMLSYISRLPFELKHCYQEGTQSRIETLK